MLSRSPGDDRLETLVGVILRAAQLHGTAVNLVDLSQLLQTRETPEELARAFESHPRLSRRYALREGFVVKRTGSYSSAADRDGIRDNFVANVRAAKWLTSRLGGEAVLVAVSGSTSYKTASRKDDVDLFCVTRPGTMWVFLARALILTRLSKLFDRSRAPICLSCVMDESYARKLFSADRGALFARDALVAEVVLGRDQYDSLLESAPWVGRYFPRLYALRRSPGRQRKDAKGAGSAWTKVANLLLFITLGSYIRAKARLHNNLLAKQGNDLYLFQVRIGLDHLIYESDKYIRLREMYDEIQPIPREANGQITAEGLAELSPHSSEAR